MNREVHVSEVAPIVSAARAMRLVVEWDTDYFAIELCETSRILRDNQNG